MSAGAAGSRASPARVRGCDMAAGREGRGWLSSIEQLPEEAREDIVWAAEQLNARQRKQADILFELNDRLSMKGLGPLSKSAFNRYSLKRSMAATRVAEMRDVFAGLADQFTPERIDEGNLLIGEFIKMLILELTQDGTGSRTPKEAMELARAYASAVQGQKAAAERRAAAFETKRAALLNAVDAAAGAVEASNPGADLKAAIKRIRAEIYGIVDEPPVQDAPA